MTKSMFSSMIDRMNFSFSQMNEWNVVYSYVGFSLILHAKRVYNASKKSLMDYRDGKYEIDDIESSRLFPFSHRNLSFIDSELKACEYGANKMFEPEYVFQTFLWPIEYLIKIIGCSANVIPAIVLYMNPINAKQCEDK